MINLLFQEAAATGSCWCPSLALAHRAQGVEGAGAGATASVWRRCSRRTSLLHSQQNTGKLPRPLLFVLLETMKGKLLAFFSFISGIARLLKVIMKGITSCPQKHLLFSPLSGAGVPLLAPCAFAYKLWGFSLVIPLPSTSRPFPCCHHMSLECFK